MWWLKPAASRPEAHDAVGDHHVAQHGHFFVEQLVALGLHHEKFQAVPERQLKLRRVPRLADVFVNRAAVDGGDRGVEIRVGRDQDAQDARTQCRARSSSQTPFSPGIRWSVSSRPISSACCFEQLEAVLRVGGGEHAEIVAEGARRNTSAIFPRHPRRGWRIFCSRRDCPWRRCQLLQPDWLLTGNSSVNSQNFPGSVFTEILPPYSCMML